jgi:hypothetical protein
VVKNSQDGNFKEKLDAIAQRVDISVIAKILQRIDKLESQLLIAQLPVNSPSTPAPLTPKGEQCVRVREIVELLSKCPCSGNARVRHALIALTNIAKVLKIDMNLPAWWDGHATEEDSDGDDPREDNPWLPMNGT